MKPKRGLITLQSAWIKLNLAGFLDDRPKQTEDFVEFMVDVIDTRNSRGILVRSRQKQEIGGRGSELFIPWKYVEGIVWPDDIAEIENRIGFGNSPMRVVVPEDQGA